jgi:hypothetical protein
MDEGVERLYVGLKGGGDTQFARSQASDNTLTGSEIIRKTTEETVQIRERMKTARDSPEELRRQEEETLRTSSGRPCSFKGLALERDGTFWQTW